MKISIRTKYFAGGSSIDTSITALPEDVDLYDPKDCGFWEPSRSFERRDFYCKKWSPEVERVLGMVKKRASRYNFDHSNPMTDYFNVNFYYGDNVKYELQSKELDELYQHFKTGTYRPEINSNGL